MLPRFTLQPVVENSIIHGIEPKVHGGSLRIKAYQENSCVVIKIIDNGVGMTKEKRNAILSLRIKGNTGQITAIGLANVISRLKIFCEAETCFFIKSKLGLGTITTIKIPFKENGDVHTVNS